MLKQNQRVMKAIITAAAVFFSLFTFAGNDGDRASEILHIEGHTMNDANNCGQVLVSVYADGELETQFYSSKKGKFDFYLDANTYYDIGFEKEGFASKKVKVNTYTQKLNFEFYEFGFDMEMQTQNELGTDEAVAANIQFNKKRRRFTYIR